MATASSTRSLEDIASVQLVVGMEIHVELATNTKLFTRVANPARTVDGDEAELAANQLIDPVVLALPGALPVLNKAAVELSMLVGLALRCSIAKHTKWDRKSYFYPDLPKAYQISQYDLPLCFDGSIDVPAVDAKGFPDLTQEGTRIGIIRAHLEEDAGKLLHDAPGGGHLDFSIADYNRAGTPLLEIVTQPDFTSADQAVLFAKMLRNICRFVGATEGVMQKGHMRFEPNINCKLTMRDGSVVKTPIVEVKNLNSFKSLKGAIEFELVEQPGRWVEDGRVAGPGMKITRGWDDAANRTFVQREKEDAHDYRYFPDPDLPPVRVDERWLDAVRAKLPELPMDRFKRYVQQYNIAPKEAFALVDERDVCFFYERVIDAMVLGGSGIERDRAGKIAANLILQQCFKRANEKGVEVDQLGISPAQLAAIGVMREKGELNNQSLEVMVDACLIEADRSNTTNETYVADAEGASALQGVFERVRAMAAAKGLLVVKDDAQTKQWIAQVIAANPKVAEDVRSGKVAAAGRLVGEVMKLAAGKADAKTVRGMLFEELGVKE
ncbi:MAG: Asp-tRNA(Asn)/Glu-tRNA(Gln) amidotransferase subunit GatB [Phycisphaerales bacterium]